GRDAGEHHGLGDREPLPGMAEGELEPDRLGARQAPQAVDELQQLDRGGEGRVARWRDAVRPRRHAARLGDLFGDLGRGQHPAMARLRALGQLDLDHPDLLARRIGDEALLVEAALGVAAAELAAADLPDEVAAELAVVAGDRALARVVRETPELGAAIERPD